MFKSCRCELFMQTFAQLSENIAENITSTRRWAATKFQIILGVGQYIWGTNVEAGRDGRGDCPGGCKRQDRYPFAHAACQH